MNEPLTALVTAGGTSEPVDDVRVLTNISTGRFGHMLANELALQGVHVTELLRRASVPLIGSTLEKLSGDRVAVEAFTTAENLRAAMVNRAAPSIVLHAAAVADYSPVKAEGKLRSDAEELTLKLKRNPKILAELRPAYGSKTFIAGFKLLSGVSDEELIAAAQQQLKANRLNMVIANDLQKLREGEHPVIVVTAEGGTLRFSGQREAVAKELVAFIVKRARTHWFRSVAEELSDRTDHSGFDATLSLAHKLNLLYDASGNVSARIPGGLLVSPRQIDKSLLTPENAIYTQVDLRESIVRFAPISATMPGAQARLQERGELKPSIDTGMSAMLYDAFSEVESIIHFHSGWGRMEHETRFPYPCGAREESEEIMAVMGDSRVLAAELVHHGFLLGLKRFDRERLADQWDSIRAEYMVHLQEVREMARLEPARLRPVWDGANIVGLIQADPAGSAVYLSTRARGRGVGAKVVQQLKERRYVIKTVDDCGVRDFYKGQGFTEAWAEEQRVYLLTPSD